MPGDLPVAAHTFDFKRVYTSIRSGGAPGSGVWTTPITIFDGKLYPSFSECLSFSAGAITGNISEPRGIFGQTDIGLAYLGNGLPDTPVLINEDNAFGYWDTSQGVWSYKSSLFLLSLGSSGVSSNNITLLRSNDGGLSWAIQDDANSPNGTSSISLRAAVQRINNTIYVFMFNRDLLQHNIWGFDMLKSKWGAPFAPVNFGSAPIFSGGNSTCSNGLYKWTNGDFGVLYSDGTNVFYREWQANSGTWQTPVVLPGKSHANSLINTNLGFIHVFAYSELSGGAPKNSSVIYSTVRRGGIVTPSIFTIPAPVASSDGIGHCSIQQGLLLAPRDDNADFDNSVWVASLSDGQFYKERLPVPAGEEGAINTYSIAAQGGGYAVNDTGTINGGVSGFFATYRVTSVSSGIVTGIVITDSGGGYSAAPAIGTTPGGSQPGAGTGFTLDILTVKGKTPSCAYMMFANGYAFPEFSGRHRQYHKRLNAPGH